MENDWLGQFVRSDPLTESKTGIRRPEHHHFKYIYHVKTVLVIYDLTTLGDLN